MKTRITNIAAAVVFAAASLWLLAIDNSAYLQKAESLSLFQSTREFFVQCMMLPGGVLRWASLWLTQLFYYPWLGATVYTAFLLAIAIVAHRSLRLPRWSFPLMLVVPAVILKMFLGLGYVIFSLKTPGFAFMMPLGVLCALLLCRACTCWRTAWLRAFAVAVATAAGYCLMGFYGLLAGGLACVMEAVCLVRRRSPNVSAVGIGVLAICLVPQTYYTHIPNHLRSEDKYTVCLPWLYEGEHWWQSYTDDNFRLTIDLDRALWDGDWHRALQTAARNQGFEPTRLNVILTDMALIRTGKAPEALLKYRVGSAPYNTVRSLRVTHDAAAMLFCYHTGLVNAAYRWAMESTVEYGNRVEYLKMMAKCALLNGDYGVAAKCLDNLSLTAFHKDWAEKYRDYLRHHELIDKDEELAAIKAIMRHEDRFMDDNGQLEGYVWRELGSIQRGGNELLELSMVANMIRFSIDDFVNRVHYYYAQNHRLPLYFQQAVVFWSKHNGNNFYEQFDIDPSLLDNYNRFIQSMELYQNFPKEQQTELLRKNFGDTYWFYCYCLSGNMKVI